MMKFFSAILCSGLLFCWVRADFIQKAGNQQFRWEENGTLHGAFAFIIGEDLTYLQIDDCSWLSDVP